MQGMLEDLGAQGQEFHPDPVILLRSHPSAATPSKFQILSIGVSSSVLYRHSNSTNAPYREKKRYRVVVVDNIIRQGGLAHVA
jgi:hypothetical protein